jgi:hypothetical protein
MDRSFEPANDLYEDADVLDSVEAVLAADSRPYERMDDEIHFAAPVSYCDLHGVFVTREDIPSLGLTLLFDQKVPRQRRVDVQALVCLLNEMTWIGHFELGSDEGTVLWRHVSPLIARGAPEPAEVAAILAAGVEACERFYPALNFLLWAGKSPREAAEAALFETAGEA